MPKALKRKSKWILSGFHPSVSNSPFAVKKWNRCSVHKMVNHIFLAISFSMQFHRSEVLRFLVVRLLFKQLVYSVVTWLLWLFMHCILNLILSISFIKMEYIILPSTFIKFNCFYQVECAMCNMWLLLNHSPVSGHVVSRLQPLCPDYRSKPKPLPIPQIIS